MAHHQKEMTSTTSRSAHGWVGGECGDMTEDMGVGGQPKWFTYMGHPAGACGSSAFVAFTGVEVLPTNIEPRETFRQHPSVCSVNKLLRCAVWLWRTV